MNIYVIENGIMNPSKDRFINKPIILLSACVIARVNRNRLGKDFNHTAMRISQYLPTANVLSVIQGFIQTHPKLHKTINSKIFQSTSMIIMSGGQTHPTFHLIFHPTFASSDNAYAAKCLSNLLQLSTRMPKKK